MRYLLVIACYICSLTLLGQPVFETSYTESANICQLETLGEVYYSMDVVNKQCHIYDMDHQLLKTIPLPTPEGYYLEDIQYISENLFNSDGLVELVYIYSKYVPTDLSYYFTYESKLINENGTTLLTLPGVGFTQVLETASQGKKFLAYEYNYSVIPYTTSTHVYSLPEPTTSSNSQALSGYSNANPWPNPAMHVVNIPVTLPHGEASGSIEVSDMNGRRVMIYPFSKSTGVVQLPTRRLAPGTYNYQVVSDNTSSEAQKIIIR